MVLEKLGKAAWLLPHEVDSDDVVEVVDAPFVVPADKTKWNRPRGRATVKLQNGELRTWTFNTTTWDELVDGFGTNETAWIGRRIVVKKELRNVNGVDKEILFGYPYVEPQQTLDADNPIDLSEDAKKQFKAFIVTLSPEERRQLLEGEQK